MVEYQLRQTADLLTLSCSAGGQEGPALDTGHHEVAGRGERGVVESLTGLGPALVQVSVKPEAELAAPRSDHKILAAALKKEEFRADTVWAPVRPEKLNSNGGNNS